MKQTISETVSKWLEEETQSKSQKSRGHQEE